MYHIYGGHVDLSCIIVELFRTLVVNAMSGETLSGHNRNYTFAYKARNVTGYIIQVVFELCPTHLPVGLRYACILILSYAIFLWVRNII